MGQSLAHQRPLRTEALQQAQALLRQYSTEFTELEARVQRAEKVQQSQRFDWVGAAPAREALAEAYPLPPELEPLTVIASDGSQILPDQHAIYPYYLINVGSIIYRHGSNSKPETYNPTPILCYEPFDEQGRLISTPEINVQRDLAELQVLIDRVQYVSNDPTGPIVTLLDGRLPLRVIDLPFDQQEKCQKEYIDMLDTLRAQHALLAGYVDRPRSTFVLSLMHLASLNLEAIGEETLRHNPFRQLTDLELFDFLGPGQRSAIFTMKAKGLDKYEFTGHTIQFFYLNVGSAAVPALARVEVPAWLAADRPTLNILHAAIVRQARITGGYPYVLARADELAVISGEEREAVEMMLGLEMRRQGLVPEVSAKQRHKNAFRFSRRF